MALMDEAVWGGKIYSGGWVAGDLGAGGVAAVIEPATRQQIGRTGHRHPGSAVRLTWKRSPTPAG